MIIELLLIYVTYLIIIIVGSYYVNLYITKDQFTKEELKNILPFLSEFWNNIAGSYSLLALLAVLLVFSLIGILITMLSDFWFLNSAILFVIMYLVFPLARKNFNKARVTTGGGFSDNLVNFFLQYDTIILIGFGAGTATALMYNWSVFKAVPFLWFLINIIALTILLGLVIKKITYK